MGMTDIFSDNANFSSITGTPLKVEKVVQIVDIEVNEAGSIIEARTGKFCFLYLKLKIFVFQAYIT